MHRTHWGSHIVASCLMALGMLAGCQSTPEWAEPQATEVSKKPRPEDTVRSTMAIPTGERSTSALWLEHTAPAEVSQSQQFDSEIKATNLTKNTLHSVQVTDYCSANFKLIDSDPAPQSSQGGVLRWDLGSLEPGETKTIAIRGSATEVGTVKSCIDASYESRSCLAINVVNPKLQLTIQAPAEALQCDAIPVRFTVTNSGTGVARNVLIQDALPKGLTTDKGSEIVTLSLGDLAANQAKSVSVTLRAAATGSFENKATASAEGGLSIDATAATAVRKPELAIDQTGPERIFVGREFAYTLTVTNQGDGEARDTVVETTVPAVAKVVSTHPGAATEGGRLVWRVGKLNPGDSATARVTLVPNSISAIESTTTAKAYCAATASDSVKTNVQGIPAILLEVIDLSDPIQVGSNETYEITATNQGSAADSNIQIVCTLEDAMEFVSAEGVTQGTVEGHTVTFAPLSILPPKTKATWRVTVKSLSPGDVRFQATMTSDQLKRPVEETEATNFYE